MEARDGGVPSLTSLAGPLLIGALFSYFLYGAFFVQSIHYFQTNKFSRTHIRSLILVAFVSLVELASVIGVTGNVYHILCKLIPRGDFSFQAPPMAMLLAVYLSLVAVAVQAYFSLRIYRLSGRRLGVVISIFISLMGLTQLATSTLITYVAFSAQRELARLTYDTLQQKAITLWLASAAAADFTITATLVYLYMGFRKKTERPESRSIINMLILHTVENGAVTSLCALLQLAFYSAKPDSLIFIAFSYINGRLYANVLLASLNTNRTFQRQVISDTDYTMHSLPLAQLRQGLQFPPATSGASRRRHSLSAPYQRPTSPFIPTKT